jgi:hypothetical protein
MRTMLATLFIMFSTQAFSAPTYHELAEGLATITNANNMMDGTPTFLVCFDSAGGFDPTNDDQWLESRQVYTTTVFVRVTDEDFTSTRKVVYSLTTGPFFTLQSLSLLGQELVDENTELSCSADAIAYQFTL